MQPTLPNLQTRRSPSRPSNYMSRYSMHCSAKYPKIESAATGLQSHKNLDHEPLNLVLQAPDLVHQITGLVGGDASSDDGSAHAARSPQRAFRANIHVRDILVLAEQGQVEKDGEGSGVGGEDDDLGGAAVESLGCLVGSLVQLLVVRGLLDDIEDLLAESCVGDGPGCANVRRVLEGG